MPALSSVLYRLIKFIHTLEFWGFVLILYSLTFTIYAGRNRCGREERKKLNEQPEEEETFLNSREEEDHSIVK